MELYRLRSFLTILQVGNLTRAAEQLNLSQSALSSQLRQLEEELGLKLFRRTPRGMEPSAAGNELLPAVEAVFAEVDKLSLKARLLRQQGGENLHIGLNADPGFLRVGALNRRLSQLHPELNVIFVASRTSRAPQLLRLGRLDLAFGYDQLTAPDLRCRELARVPFCIAIPKPLLGSGLPPDWAQLAELPWIWVEQDSPPYAAILHQLQLRRLTPNRAVNAVDEYIVRELLIDGQGVAVMREDEARPLAAKGSVRIWERGGVSLPLCLSWLAGNEDRPRIRSGREAILHLWRDPDTLDDQLNRLHY